MGGFSEVRGAFFVISFLGRTSVDTQHCIAREARFIVEYIDRCADYFG